MYIKLWMDGIWKEMYSLEINYVRFPCLWTNIRNISHWSFIFLICFIAYFRNCKSGLNFTPATQLFTFFVGFFRKFLWKFNKTCFDFYKKELIFGTLHFIYRVVSWQVCKFPIMNTCWQKTVSKTCWSYKRRRWRLIDLSSGYPNHNQRLKFDPALDNRFGLRGALIRN